LNLIERCPDGTIKYRNPFSGTECWYTPGRRHRPVHTEGTSVPQLLKKVDVEGYCTFCPKNYFYTTPEKSRVINIENFLQIQRMLTANQIFAQPALFRRISNLFEIISIDYWKKNYSYSLTSQQIKMKENYLSSELGREHVRSLLEHITRRSSQQKARIEDSALYELADGFFGGAHDLILPQFHFRPDAVTDHDLYSTGEMTAFEHHIYTVLTIDALSDIYEQNRFVRFAGVYTNWRRDAGATLEHLHRQILGLDFWGYSIGRCVRQVSANPEVFNDYVNYLKNQHNLAICENDYAVAVADIGQPFSTVAVFSKSSGCRPFEHTHREVEGFSEILLSIHAALGSGEACNEEWYYPPRDSDCFFPWFVLIKWRKNRHAGIEGTTRLYIDTYRPEEIRDMMIDRLHLLRTSGKFNSLLIGKNGIREKRSLKYNSKKSS